MKIVSVDRQNASDIAPLTARLRVELKALRGIKSRPDPDAGLTELCEYLDAGFPCFAALEDGRYAGYLVCRVDAPTVWVESIFVEEAFRRRGIASALLCEAERVAASYGENTVFHYVHPNNDRMIAFLRKHGYTVLNLIEIRKPYPGERPERTIRVGDHTFDY